MFMKFIAGTLLSKANTYLKRIKLINEIKVLWIVECKKNIRKWTAEANIERRGEQSGTRACYACEYLATVERTATLSIPVLLSNRAWANSNSFIHHHPYSYQLFFITIVICLIYSPSILLNWNYVYIFGPQWKKLKFKNNKKKTQSMMTKKQNCN